MQGMWSYNQLYKTVEQKTNESPEAALAGLLICF